MARDKMLNLVQIIQFIIIFSSLIEIDLSRKNIERKYILNERSR